jgi:hypothetical protein
MTPAKCMFFECFEGLLVLQMQPPQITRKFRRLFREAGALAPTGLHGMVSSALGSIEADRAHYV